MLQHQLAVLVDLGLHDLERKAVIAPHEAHQLAGVLHGQKALGRLDVQIDVQADYGGQQREGQARVAQHAGERSAVPIMHAREGGLHAGRAGRGGGGVGMRARLQPARAQGRDDRHRHHQRDHRGRDQRDGELAEQAFHQPAHEQDGHEDDAQRHRHRHQRKAHFAHAAQRGLGGR
ncbi:hypothetical protein D3C71_1609700 [compost metagenome]